MWALGRRMAEGRREGEGTMPRGGRREGAGAPRGNTNALKHGRRSKLLKRMVEKLMADDEMRSLLLRFSILSQQAEAGRYKEALNSNVRAANRKLYERPNPYEWLPYYDDGEAPWLHDPVHAPKRRRERQASWEEAWSPR